MISIKNILKEIRQSKDLSQQQLSIKSNVSEETISRLEINANASTNVKAAIHLAKALGVDVTDIFIE